jgi:hypothetical protein
VSIFLLRNEILTPVTGIVNTCPSPGQMRVTAAHYSCVVHTFPGALGNKQLCSDEGEAPGFPQGRMIVLVTLRAKRELRPATAVDPALCLVP